MLPQVCGLEPAQSGEVSVAIAVAPSSTCSWGQMPEGDPEFLGYPIVDDGVVVVVAAGRSHPVFERTKPTLHSLLDYSWVLPAPSIPSRQRLDAAFEGLGLLKPHARIEANSIPLPPCRIASSDLLSFVSCQTAGQRWPVRPARGGVEGDPPSPSA